MNNGIKPFVYTTLTAACNVAGVPLESARKGKRIWIKENDFVMITEVELVKMKKNGQIF